MGELLASDEYMEVLEGVKGEIARSRHRALMSVNEELLKTYWRIGARVNAHIEWGTSFVEALAADIRAEFPGVRGFSSRSLRYMAKFAREVDEEFLQQAAARIPWGHMMYLLDKTEPGDERAWYVAAAAENGWSRSVLMHQVDTGLYARQALADKVTNFDRTLPQPESDLARDALKDPYVFDFVMAGGAMAERELEDEMVRNVTSLLLELGTGFAFMGRQYHLEVDGQDFYIDLLFYNTRIRSHVVVELKADEFKPEYAGKLNFYLAAVDDLLRGEHDRPTIGLLLCKTKSNTVAEYALRNVGSPIGVSEYRVSGGLPDYAAGVLPDPADLARRV